MNLGKLSVVATPIGNMGDITLRAVETLRSAEVIFCEDTRMTGKLLERLELPKKELIRADAEKEMAAVDRVIDFLEAGKSVVYVSDAGTPGVSDPGARLVAAIRVSVPEAEIQAVPGVSAITAAISIAGISGNAFTFLGFVPHKKGRETFFTSLAQYKHPVSFFESPHRIMKTLSALSTTMPEAQVHLGRELTKLHEEMLVGTAAELSQLLEANPAKQRGEFVVLVDQVG